MALAEDLLLAAINPRSRRIRVVERIGIAVRGAELFDLALAGRIAVDARGITVTDPAPLGDPGLDRALTELRDAAPAPAPDDWLRSRPEGAGLIRRYLTLLEEQNAVRVEQRGSGDAVRTRIIVLDHARRDLVLARIAQVARADDAPAAQDGALATLVHAGGLDRYLLRGPRARQARRRLGRLAERTGHPAIAGEIAAGGTAGGARFASGRIEPAVDNTALSTNQVETLVRHAYQAEDAGRSSGHSGSGSGHHGAGHHGGGAGGHGGGFGGGGGHH